MEEPQADLADFAEITSHYLPGRECLLLAARLEPVFVDYYLHFGELRFQLETVEDSLLKDFLAVVVLHACARPRTERHAWTLHLPGWPRNFFATVESPEERVVGRVFRDDIATGDQPTLGALVQTGQQAARQSSVALDSPLVEGAAQGIGEVALAVAEEFYARSEQRPARFVRGAGDDYLMLAAMPGADLGWVQTVSDEEIRDLAAADSGNFMERRALRWACSCSLERIFPVIAPMLRRADPPAEGAEASDSSNSSAPRFGEDSLFGPDETLTITCPRCARRYILTREQAEAMLGESGH